MNSQKVRREKIKYPYQTERDIPVLGREIRMKVEREDQENYFALRLGRRHHPPLIEHRPPLMEVLEDETKDDAVHR